MRVNSSVGSYLASGTEIVHRGLKLENVLLNRHRNVIIMDFGFANRFEHTLGTRVPLLTGYMLITLGELV
jgi:5'-AMP-activated protein kinase catalytic alpha subunit